MFWGQEEMTRENLGQFLPHKHSITISIIISYNCDQYLIEQTSLRRKFW